MYAKIHFERSDVEYEEIPADHDRLLTPVMEAFNCRFKSYRSGAEARDAYTQAKADVDGDPHVTMFGVMEDFRAAVAARPGAGTWQAFRKEATAAIAPFFFTMDFIDG